MGRREAVRVFIEPKEGSFCEYPFFDFNDKVDFTTNSGACGLGI